MNRKFTIATMVAIAPARFGVPAIAQDIPRYVPSIGKRCPEGYVYLPSIHRGRGCQLGTSIRPDPEITCTGILIDVDVRSRAIWPLGSLQLSVVPGLTVSVAVRVVLPAEACVGEADGCSVSVGGKAAEVSQRESHGDRLRRRRARGEVGIKPSRNSRSFGLCPPSGTNSLRPSMLHACCVEFPTRNGDL